VRDAVAAEHVLYDTHPLWDAEIPGVDASEEEWAAYDALQSDEEAQWAAIYEGMYTACASPDEWWAAAQKYPFMAGYTDASALTRDSILSWCYGREDAPMCTGADEWVTAG